MIISPASMIVHYGLKYILCELLKSVKSVNPIADFEDKEIFWLDGDMYMNSWHETWDSSIFLFSCERVCASSGNSYWIDFQPCGSMVGWFYLFLKYS